VLRFSTILAALAISGCAATTAVPITADNPNPKGFRVYGAKPIAVVTGSSVKIDYIPNYSEAYAVRMESFFAKNETTLTINANGTLATVESNLDSAEALGKLLDFAETVLEKTIRGGAAASGEIKTDSSGALRIYDFVYDERGELIGMRSLLPEPVMMRAAAPASALAVAPATVVPVEEGGGGSLTLDNGKKDGES